MGLIDERIERYESIIETLNNTQGVSLAGYRMGLSNPGEHFAVFQEFQINLEEEKGLKSFWKPGQITNIQGVAKALGGTGVGEPSSILAEFHPYPMGSAMKDVWLEEVNFQNFINETFSAEDRKYTLFSEFIKVRNKDAFPSLDSSVYNLWGAEIPKELEKFYKKVKGGLKDE